MASQEAELVLAELLELSPAGVEEVTLADGRIEYALYGAPGELPELPVLRAAAGEAVVEVSTTAVPDGWERRWRRFHQPLVLGSRLCVRPPWEPPCDTQVDVVIDPGQAFGTGAHASTRLCLELLLELDPRGAFLDVGCGSGVLSIAAVLMGFDPVSALDSDPGAIDATLQNARRNRVSVAARRLDIRREPLPAAPTMAANLLRPLLLGIAPRIPAEVQRLIASGLLSEEGDEVSQAFGAHGLCERARRTSGEWAALLLERPVP